MRRHARAPQARRRTLDIRDAPAYSFLTAARCLGMPQATLRRWVHGGTSNTGGRRVVSRPLIRAPAGTSSHISFNNLVEAHVVRAFRTRHGVRIAALRDSIEYAERKLQIRRLLMSGELRTAGQDFVLARLSKLITLSRSERLALQQGLEVHLDRIDRDADALPFRLYPLRPTWSPDRKPIVIDPRISFGRPTLAGSGFSTATLVDRLGAGETVQELAHDYRLDIGQIEDAVVYERTG